MRRRLPLLLALLAIGASAEDMRPFVPGSFERLLTGRSEQPILLVLWSITCAPCREELGLLAAMRKKHPNLPVVLISTDDIADRATVTATLRRYDLNEVESWIFADTNTQWLRYEIDPAWYGEMPRSYLYDAGHRRQAISGSLTREQVEDWLGE